MKKLLIFFSLIGMYAIPIYSQGQSNQKLLRITKEKTSLNQSMQLFMNEYRLDKEYSFKPIYSNRDKAGNLHQKFQQFYKTIKVEFGVMITHSKEDNVYLVNGELYNTNGLSIVPSLNSTECFNKAINDIGATSYLWNDIEQATIIGYEKPVGELVFLPILSSNEVKLAFKYDIYATNPVSRQEVYVDANTGQILLKNKIIKHIDKFTSNGKERKFGKKIKSELNLFVGGSADTRYSGTKEIETTFDGTNYVLRDQSRGDGVYTFNCQNTSTYQNVDFTDADNNWTAAEYNNAAKDNGALDAHWGAEVTYDFWTNIFNRNSYDNNGARIRSYVHYGSNYNNASWNGSVMTYGDGSSFDILTALDVCAHEIGHAICTYTANLVYQNESGAMNEGFSDIWGACIEHYGKTGSFGGNVASSVWEIGEELSSSPLRSMSNPNSVGDPDTYQGTNWYTGTADNGGVHTNSSVLNHWFYILSEGESGTNNAPLPDTYNVTGIGIEKAAEIAYLTERDYLTTNSTYADARNASIEVASSIYCANSPEVIAVTNAWFAVNVGDEYVSVSDDVSLQRIVNDNDIICSGNVVTVDLKLKNQGLNSISQIDITYTIDGGASQSNTWTGNLATCTEVVHPLSINGLTRGAHVLNVTSTIVNDGRPENNTKEIVLLVNDEGTVNQVNPFTDATDALISYDEGGVNSQWVRGERTGGVMDSGTGNYVYTTNLSGNYPDQKKSFLLSQCYNLSVLSNPEISFLMKFDLEVNWDVVYVEYSTDFGTNWTVLGEMTSGWYNSDRTQQTAGNDCYNCPGAQWTGTNTTNTTYNYPLSAIGSATNVIFRIVFHSDEAVNQLGVNIDDFLISGVLSQEGYDIDQVKLYPNPVNEEIHITTGELRVQNIEIFDSIGKSIYNTSFSNNNSVMHSIDLSGFSTGIYFIKLNTDKGVISKRIVKE